MQAALKLSDFRSQLFVVSLTICFSNVLLTACLSADMADS